MCLLVEEGATTSWLEEIQIIQYFQGMVKSTFSGALCPSGNQNTFILQQ